MREQRNYVPAEEPNNEERSRMLGLMFLLFPSSVLAGVLVVLVFVIFGVDVVSWATFIAFWVTFLVAYWFGMVLAFLTGPMFLSWYVLYRKWKTTRRD